MLAGSAAPGSNSCASSPPSPPSGAWIGEPNRSTSSGALRSCQSHVSTVATSLPRTSSSTSVGGDSGSSRTTLAPESQAYEPTSLSYQVGWIAVQYQRPGRSSSTQSSLGWATLAAA